MKSLISLLFTLLPLLIYASQFSIGPEFTYISPNAFYMELESGNIIVKDGDTLNISSGEYRGQDALAIWRANNLLIRGVGGRTELYADGSYIIGKGIFVSAGDDIIYENIAFFDAAVPDKNGAGIRLDGSGLTVKNCLFFNNENGILANNSESGEVLIEYSEFGLGGAGDGFSHNIYINHCALLTIQFCYFHNAEIGHQIKSRADKNIIQYNRIADLDGNSSRLIDISNGGQCIILGNELIQGENAVNNNLVGFGLEGISNPEPHTLFVANNTILNYRTASCLFFDVSDATDTFTVANNILGGACKLYNGKDPNLIQNFSNEDIEVINFADVANFDLGLVFPSEAVDFGIYPERTDLIPNFEYLHPASKAERLVFGELDAGAHELNIIIKTEELMQERIMYPNPVTYSLYIDLPESSLYIIFDIEGRIIKEGKVIQNQINVSRLVKGMYILSVENLQPVKFFKL